MQIKVLKHAIGAFRPHHKIRSTYWSCSKLADWIRGVGKPYALELDKWDEWDNKISSERPTRYWLAEKGLNHLQNILYYPYDKCSDIYYYINARWVVKYHMVNTGLKPGRYYDPDQRLEYACFSLLHEWVDRRGYDFIKENDSAECQELLSIYDWWKDLPCQEAILEEKLSQIYEKRDADWVDQYNSAEQKFVQDRTEKLNRLIELRAYMWH